MRKALKVEVTNCYDCPFLMEPSTADRYDDMCTAVEGHRAQKLVIGFLNNVPPRWCPLRKHDHLVTLRVK